MYEKTKAKNKIDWHTWFLQQTYLPKDSASGTGYAEGGGLYALGLIHANHGADITDYLIGQLKEGSNEPLRHGGCLGLGLAAMGTHRADVYEQLRSNLYQVKLH